jgi:enterochelin esterase-like enzyme
VKSTHTNAPQIDAEGVTFAVADADDELTAVHLAQEILRPRTGPAFIKENGSHEWRLRLRRPEAHRIEYKLQLTHRNGNIEVICDPANPIRAAGAFGDKSVIEWPEYAPPAWVSAEVERGSIVELAVASRVLRRDLPVALWTSPGHEATDALPLLVIHDGPEYDKFSQLTHFLGWAITSRGVPPHRAALLAPVDRDETYSASAVYSRALAHEVLPALSDLAPTPHGRTMRAGMGASLGALSMLHAHRTNPATFGSLFLQSGSFFRQRFDSQEARFSRFRRITRFVGRVATGVDWAHPVSVSMTCGSAEENLHNNRYMRDALLAQGYDVFWHEQPDAHNWTSWRDTFDPHLIRLLQRMWS